jgi:hypothetical protein
MERNSSYSSFHRMHNPTPPSLSVRDVTRRKWRLRSRTRFVCCSLRSMNQLFLFSGPSGDNFRVIHPATTLGVGIIRFRQRGCLCKGKSAGRPRVSEETVERVRQSSLRAPCESWIGDVDDDCVEGAAKETGNEALSSSLGAVSSIILVRGV